MQVIRDGRPVEISIFDIVVGDVVPLNIGDQVSVQLLNIVLNTSIYFTIDLNHHFLVFYPGPGRWSLNYWSFSWN